MLKVSNLRYISVKEEHEEGKRKEKRKPEEKRKEENEQKGEEKKERKLEDDGKIELIIYYKNYNISSDYNGILNRTFVF